jgi:class 3 adenylate cyclase
MPEIRKLAAILAADVAGYSKLAGADEERTLARLRALRSDLFDPTIALHHGRVVKRTGDGVLIEFRSVVDAVRCAIEVQNGMAERNAGLPPERRIEFRVGIHLGDVVEESDGDLMGDGVNIAARLEGIAKPGAICLSEDAYRQVKSRLDVAVSDLGSAQLKNIAEPVHVYSVEVGKPARLYQRHERTSRSSRCWEQYHGSGTCHDTGRDQLWAGFTWCASLKLLFVGWAYLAARGGVPIASGAFGGSLPPLSLFLPGTGKA